MATPEPDVRCAALARGLGEPLAGTAPTAARWVCLEQPEPWPRDLAQHPQPDIRAFAARASATGFRLLLIRRPGSATSTGPQLLYLADTDPARTATTSHRLTGLTELATLELPAPGARLTGEPEPGPLLLVCAADRDPCCGADGQALFDALAAADDASAGEPDVWACSHLGGHRFAPTALVLPTGYVYGHLDVASALAARAAATAGQVATDRCRGRSTWSPEGQVAELAVRAATGPRAADALAVHVPDSGPVSVTDGGAEWTVEVEAVDSDVVRPASCGARPTLMAPLRAATVHAPPD